jgi:hypothetical protein
MLPINSGSPGGDPLFVIQVTGHAARLEHRRQFLQLDSLPAEWRLLESTLDLNVVRSATLTDKEPGGWKDCCIKYKNNPAKPLENAEILHFIQQS